MLLHDMQAAPESGRWATTATASESLKDSGEGQPSEGAELQALLLVAPSCA